MAFSGKCPGCGQDLSDVKFCTKCGRRFTENIGEKPKSAAKKKLSKGGIILGLLIVMAILGVVFYQGYEKKINTPQYVIKKVLSTWKEGKYEKVYSYLDASKLDTKEFLSKEDFVKAMENNKLGEYSLEIADEDISNLTKVEYQVSMVLNGKSVVKDFVLENKVTSNNHKSKWCLDPKMFIRDVSVIIPSYLETKVNDKKVISDEGQNSKIIIIFKGAALKVEYVGSIVKPNAKNFVALEDLQEISPEYLNVKPTDEARNKIIAHIKDYVVFNNNFNKETGKNTMGKIFNENSSAWNNCLYFFNEYASQPTKIIKSELEKVDFLGDWIGLSVKELKEFESGNGETVYYKLIVNKDKNFKIDSIE